MFPPLKNNRPPILDPKFRDILIKTINMLPPEDFLNLATASKEMREICYRSPGVSVQFGLKMTFVLDNGGIITEFEHKNIYLTWKEMEKITKLPFHIVVLQLSFGSSIRIGSALIASTRYYLEKMGVSSVCHIRLPRKGNWNELIELIRDYKPETVTTNHSYMNSSDAKEILRLNHLKKFSFLECRVDDKDILSTNILELSVVASLKNNTIERILQQWMSKSLVIVNWSIHRPLLTPSGFRSHFLRFPMFHVDHYNGFLPSCRPLVIVKTITNNEHFFLLRNDDRVLNVCYSYGNVLNMVEEKKFSESKDILEEIKNWEYDSDNEDD